MPLTTSNNLDSVPAVPGQATPENTVNDKLGEHDSFLTRVLGVSVSSGNATVSLADYRRYRSYRVTGNTVGGRSLTLQAVTRSVEIDNSDVANTQSIAIKLGSTTLNLAVGKKGIYETDGTANGIELIVSNEGAQLPEMTAAEYRANTAGRLLSTDKVWAAAATVTLTDAATVIMDFNTFINAKLTGTGGVGTSRTLGAASNAKVGQSGVIEWFPITGALTLVIPTGSSYVAAGGIAGLVLSNTNGARDAIAYTVLNDGKILMSINKGLAT